MILTALSLHRHLVIRIISLCFWCFYMCFCFVPCEVSFTLVIGDPLVWSYSLAWIQSVTFGFAVLQHRHRSLRPKQWTPQALQRQSPGHSSDDATDGIKRPSRPVSKLQPSAKYWGSKAFTKHSLQQRKKSRKDAGLEAACSTTRSLGNLPVPKLAAIERWPSVRSDSDIPRPFATACRKAFTFAGGKAVLPSSAFCRVRAAFLAAICCAVRTFSLAYMEPARRAPFLANNSCVIDSCAGSAITRHLGHNITTSWQL